MSVTLKPETGPPSETKVRPSSGALPARLIDLVRCLAAPAGLVSEQLVEHNTLTARIAGEMASVLGLAPAQQERVVLAGLLHDIGAIRTELPLADLRAHAQMQHDGHAELGWRVLEDVDALREIAPLVRYHHHSWLEGAGQESQGDPVPDEAHLLNLSDLVAVMVDRRVSGLEQPNQICRAVRSQAGNLLQPRHVEAFLELATQGPFWQDSLIRPAEGLEALAAHTSVALDGTLALQLAATFSLLADLRCGASPTHGVSVGTIAAALGELGGWPAERVEKLRIAGYVHDIGQLAVPVSLLNRPDRLNEAEWRSVRTHPHLASHVLRWLDGFEEISLWISHHHERLNGTGYPERLRGDDLPLGSRILAVADSYAAMTEDRPHRSGRPTIQALREMHALAQIGQFDGDVTGLLGRHVVEIEASRLRAQTAALQKLVRLRVPLPRVGL